MMEIAKTNFVKRYEPGNQARMAALFMNCKLVINKCSLEVGDNGKRIGWR
jgi:hypothetical protein